MAKKENGVNRCLSWTSWTEVNKCRFSCSRLSTELQITDVLL